MTAPVAKIPSGELSVSQHVVVFGQQEHPIEFRAHLFADYLPHLGLGEVRFAAVTGRLSNHGNAAESAVGLMGG